MENLYLTGMSFYGFIKAGDKNIERFRNERESMRKLGDGMLKNFDEMHSVDESDKTGLGRDYKMREFELFVFEHNVKTGMIYAKAHEMNVPPELELDRHSGLTGLIERTGTGDDTLIRIMMKQLYKSKQIFHYNGVMKQRSPLIFEGEYIIPSMNEILWGDWGMEEMRR